ncbi:MAG TPA: GNAT family N-acetyltransferase [Gammaproteobacteria bacterium]|nr:GNAT family N-acetyltransferase [Gammaproteobacteria bacterium]
MTLPDTEDRPDYQFVYRDHAQALYDALVEDAFYITMEQQLGEQREAREAMLRYLDYSMVEASDYGTLYFPETHRHGVAVWSQPLAPARETQRKRAKLEFLRSQMGNASATRYQGIADFMSRQSAALVDASAWYLSIVGVLPAWQNRGLGRALIAPVLEQADRAGVPTFLETFTPRNEPFYQHLGYRVAGTFYEPTIGAHYSLMLRE